MASHEERNGIFNPGLRYRSTQATTILNVSLDSTAILNVAWAKPALFAGGTREQSFRGDNKSCWSHDDEWNFYPGLRYRSTQATAILNVSWDPATILNVAWVKPALFAGETREQSKA